MMKGCLLAISFDEKQLLLSILFSTSYTYIIVLLSQGDSFTCS